MGAGLIMRGFTWWQQSYLSHKPREVPLGRKNPYYYINVEDVEEKIILNGYMEIIQDMYERIVQALCGKIIEFQFKLD